MISGSNTEQHVAELLYLVTDTKTPSVTLPPPLNSDPRVKSGQLVFHNPVFTAGTINTACKTVKTAPHSPRVHQWRLVCCGNKQTDTRIATLNQNWLYLHPLFSFTVIFLWNAKGEFGIFTNILFKAMPVHKKTRTKNGHTIHDYSESFQNITTCSASKTFWMMSQIPRTFWTPPLWTPDLFNHLSGMPRPLSHNPINSWRINKSSALHLVSFTYPVDWEI